LPHCLWTHYGGVPAPLEQLPQTHAIAQLVLEHTNMGCIGRSTSITEPTPLTAARMACLYFRVPRRMTRQNGRVIQTPSLIQNPICRAYRFASVSKIRSKQQAATQHVQRAERCSGAHVMTALRHQIKLSPWASVRRSRARTSQIGVRTCAGLAPVWGWLRPLNLDH
jgi:hypothetical protein